MQCQGSLHIHTQATPEASKQKRCSGDRPALKPSREDREDSCSKQPPSGECFHTSIAGGKDKRTKRPARCPKEAGADTAATWARLEGTTANQIIPLCNYYIIATVDNIYYIMLLLSRFIIVRISRIIVVRGVRDWGRERAYWW